MPLHESAAVASHIENDTPAFVENKPGQPVRGETPRTGKLPIRKQWGTQFVVPLHPGKVKRRLGLAGKNVCYKSRFSSFQRLPEGPVEFSFVAQDADGNRA